jgi:light-regulated signal transduction histidine kinase (bacteriophytochrome)
MQRETVNLSELAAKVVEELRAQTPERTVTIAIMPGLEVDADTRLIRIVLENLIGNAWKFSARKPSVRIEIGAAKANGQAAFFVKDNGAGFDMNYAQKLFGAFQRLHGINEFEGTGIGLATVQRIIHRHGGKVWAEGKVGKAQVLLCGVRPTRRCGMTDRFVPWRRTTRYFVNRLDLGQTWSACPKRPFCWWKTIQTTRL